MIGCMIIIHVGFLGHFYSNLSASLTAVVYGESGGQKIVLTNPLCRIFPGQNALGLKLH